MTISKKKKRTPLPQLVSDEGLFFLCACVGKNGFVDNHQYARGYSKIPRMIIEHLEKNHFLSVDILVYPLLFSARHTVELYVKEMARVVARIKAPKSDEMDNFVVKTHSLSELWEKFRDVAFRADKRFNFNIRKIEPAVLELAAFDPEGQTFRYAYDLNKKLSLEQIYNLNVGTFVEGFELLLKNLENLHYRCEQIAAEYRTCTHTTLLSRRDLELIARTLPPYSTWCEPGIIEPAVNDVMARYGITKRQAIIGIGEIKKHHLFSQMIGIEQPLQHLDVASVVRFVVRHKKLHPRRKKAIDDFTFHELGIVGTLGSKYGREKMSFVAELGQAMPPAAVADLYAVYLMGKTEAACEAYPGYLAEAISKAKGKKGIEIMLMDLFSDINARDWLLAGFISLGKHKYIKGAGWGHLI